MKKLKGESFKTTNIIIKISALKLLVWSKIPTKRKPSQVDIGNRVWIAGDTSTKKTKLLRVHKKGEPQWPRFGGYTVITETGLMRDLHQRAVRLHPSNFIKKRKSKR